MQNEPFGEIAHLFLIIFGWIWLAPTVVTLAGCVSAVWMQGRRWIIHLCVFGCVLAALPAFISLWSAIDPIAASEPTNAFTALLYSLRWWVLDLRTQSLPWCSSTSEGALPELR